MGVFTRALAAAGTAVAWLPIVATIVVGVVGSIRSGMLRVDYLMPAELFLIALVGAGLLLWASARSRSRRGLFAWGLVSMVGLWVGMQVVAVATGLASGETEATGWPWGLVMAMLAGYTLALVVIAVGGVLLVRDLLRR